MPHKHTIRVFVENGIYHVYNRGVEKRDIFLDDQDYRVFLHLLKFYLSPLSINIKHPLSNLPNYTLIRPRPLANLGGKVDLFAYCLMPNHFHLLIKQSTINGMTQLLRRLITTYSMYFNKRYKRVGYLFQGRYKAALIIEDSYLLHLSRYIHLNPAELIRSNLVSYPYSSYAYYLGIKKAPWIKPDFILSYFENSKDTQIALLSKRIRSYKEFVESYLEDPREVIGSLSLD